MCAITLHIWWSRICIWRVGSNLENLHLGIVWTNLCIVVLFWCILSYVHCAAGKTDYRAKIRLTTQDKNKYNTPKYRYVVRFVSSVVKSLISLRIMLCLIIAICVSFFHISLPGVVCLLNMNSFFHVLCDNVCVIIGIC